MVAILSSNVKDGLVNKGKKGSKGPFQKLNFIPLGHNLRTLKITNKLTFYVYQTLEGIVFPGWLPKVTSSRKSSWKEFVLPNYDPQRRIRRIPPSWLSKVTFFHSSKLCVNTSYCPSFDKLLRILITIVSLVIDTEKVSNACWRMNGYPVNGQHAPELPCSTNINKFQIFKQCYEQ